MESLQTLASLVQIRNVVDGEIARIIGRPAHPGHIAEFVAAAIFDIKLMTRASHKAIDGHFQSGPLAGRSVNIKFGSRRDGLMNLVASPNPLHHPDFYLVLTGPDIGAISSKGHHAPWCIQQVFLFESQDLLEKLALNGINPGTAASLKKNLWAEARVYPEPGTRMLLSAQQQEALRLFRGSV